MKPNSKGKKRALTVLTLTLLWLLLCHLAPYLPSSSIVTSLFSFAPPLALTIPPILALIYLMIRMSHAQDYKFSGLWLFGIGIAIVPLFGFAFNAPYSQDTPNHMIVMTFNVHKDSRTMPELLNYVKLNNVDLIFLQENTGGELSPAAYLDRGLPGWHKVADHEVAILCRWPITSFRSIPMWSRDGRSMILTDIAGPKPFQAATLHWAYPLNGKGIDTIQGGAMRQVKDAKQTNTMLSAGRLPLIFGGDFNNPPRHPLTRELSDKYESCFGAKGIGLGWTYPSGFAWTRIDHLYVNKGMETVWASVGPNLGSDHYPLIAEVAIKNH